MNEQSFNSSESRSAGSFDASRAAQLRAQAQDTFLAKCRKIERITWAYLLVCIAAAGWCVRNFLAVDDVRSWLVWGVLFVVALETTVLMKLWYWVVNSKLAVLREVKLLRMDLALQRGSDAALADLARVESPTKVPGIPQWERYAWIGGMVAVGILIGAEIGWRADRHYRASGQMSSTRKAALSAEGTALVETTYELANTTSRTLTEFTIYSDGVITNTQWIPPEESPWTDGRQRKLAVRREPDPNGPNHRDVIYLLEPVPPGQRFTLGSTFNWAGRRENGIWVLKLDQNWGYRRNQYRDTVVLPAGAELVSAEPAPTLQERLDGKAVLHFEGERGAGAKWAYEVTYRLPTQ